MPHRFPESAVFYRKLRHDFPLAVRAEAAASATTPDGSSGWRTTPQDPQG